MASSADLDCWRALGGKVTEVKKRKRFISPTGINLWQVPDHRSRDACFT